MYREPTLNQDEHTMLMVEAKAYAEQQDEKNYKDSDYSLAKLSVIKLLEWAYIAGAKESKTLKIRINRERLECINEYGETIESSDLMAKLTKEKIKDDISFLSAKIKEQEQELKWLMERQELIKNLGK